MYNTLINDSLSEIPESGDSTSFEGIDTGTVDPKKILTPRDQLALRAFDSIKKYFADVRLQGNSGSELITQAESRLSELFAYNTEQLYEIFDLRLERSRLRADLDHLNRVIVLLRAETPLHYLRFTDLQLRRLVAAVQRKLNRTAVAGEALPQSEPNVELAEAGIEHTFYEVNNPFADVDNTDTPFEIFRNWVTIFHQDGKRYGSHNPLVSDQLPTIYELNHYCRLNGKRVLEFGPLEGGNTKQMIDLGAASVLGIESNKESFTKCLLVKNAFDWRSVDFVYGDVNTVLEESEYVNKQEFDVCVASGILYHMEDPLRTIDLACRVAPVVYVWSHFATERAPVGEWVQLQDHEGRIYSGRRNTYRESDCLGGLGRFATWLKDDDLKKAFEDRGFVVEELGRVSNYKGEAIKFIARAR